MEGSILYWENAQRDCRLVPANLARRMTELHVQAYVSVCYFYDSKGRRRRRQGKKAKRGEEKRGARERDLAANTNGPSEDGRPFVIHTTYVGMCGYRSVPTNVLVVILCTKKICNTEDRSKED